MDGQIFKVSAEMMHLHAEEQQKGLGTANAASELTFFTEVTFSSSLSSFHFLSFSYSASSLRIYFLLEFTPEIMLGQCAPAVPDSIKCLVQFYYIVFYLTLKTLQKICGIISKNK